MQLPIGAKEGELRQQEFEVNTQVRTQTNQKWDRYPFCPNVVKDVEASIHVCKSLDDVVWEHNRLNNFDQNLSSYNQFENGRVFWESNIVQVYINRRIKFSPSSICKKLHTDLYP